LVPNRLQPFSSVYNQTEEGLALGLVQSIWSPTTHSLQVFSEKHFMSKDSRQGGLRKLLDLADELRALRKKIQDPALKNEAVQRLRRRSREKLRHLASELGAFRFRGSLGLVLKKLDPEHFLLLATLLRRYLRSVSPYVEGRALLSAVFETSFELLKGLELLQPESVLRREELVLVDQAEEGTEDSLLEARFRLADAVVEAFLEELGLRSSPKRVARKGYSNHREYLLDLKVLHNLFLTRSQRIFSTDSWWRVRGAAGDRANLALNRRIRAAENRIETRLSKTPGAADFPTQQFFLEFGLGKEEVLVVLHLLFLEFLEGNPYADVVQLIQLISGSEEAILRNRELFLPHSTLRKSGILEVEEMLDGRELTGEAHLADWVIDRMLGTGIRFMPIDADEQLNFHLYLKDLKSSNFLKDL